MWKIPSERLSNLAWSLSPDTINWEVTKVCPLIFRKTLPGVQKDQRCWYCFGEDAQRTEGRGSSVTEAWQGGRWGSPNPSCPWDWESSGVSVPELPRFTTEFFSDNSESQLSGHFVGSLENPSLSAVSWGIKTGSSPFQINALTCYLCFYFSPHTW